MSCCTTSSMVLKWLLNSLVRVSFLQPIGIMPVTSATAASVTPLWHGSLYIPQSCSTSLHRFAVILPLSGPSSPVAKHTYSRSQVRDPASIYDCFSLPIWRFKDWFSRSSWPTCNTGCGFRAQIDLSR